MVPMAAPESILVALSGGVDSATAAGLLVEAGHRVVGVTMRLYDASGTVASSGGRCCGPRDIEDARRVAAHLGIPYHVADHVADFQRTVVDDFVSEYLAGHTPNPCVKCNEHIKFGPLLRRARALGLDALATGHYARLDGTRLLRAVDARKDQSYFLFAMPAEERARVRFPLGGMTKDEVRAHAARLGLPNAAKPESQEICFVPDGDHAAFVERHAAIAPAAGEIVDDHGDKIGDHAGVHRFTVGQRRGIGLGGKGEPQYVIAVDALRRKVTVGPRALLRREQIRVEDVRWIGPRPDGAFAAGVQVRHRAKPVPARIAPDARDATVIFDESRPTARTARPARRPSSTTATPSSAAGTGSPGASEGPDVITAKTDPLAGMRVVEQREALGAIFAWIAPASTCPASSPEGTLHRLDPCGTLRSCRKNGGAGQRRGRTKTSKKCEHAPRRQRP